MPPEIVTVKIHTKQGETTSQDFLRSKEDENLCDNCGRKISTKSKNSGICQMCNSKFSGRILACAKCGKSTKFFWEIVGLTIVTCSQCNVNHRKELLVELKFKWKYFKRVLV